ncbi:hypothetical protein [Halorarum salinum]|uniref:Lipoprotein n=1 Tax=Halorarum salinum TaxID=2743089 RepID=A0A7D5QAC6_9EURY|nr:hypothetical protein [Halobaculum salinum]QLG62536.1 hypothetical protein HUG12_12695 [Halobaculum salinum]
MVPITRRDALRGAAALLPLAAGCNGTEFDSPSRTPTERRGPENVETDPELATLRGPGERAVVWFADGRTATDGDGPPESYHPQGFVADGERVDATRFADVDGAGAAREFLEATDFDEETVYVDQSRIGECYRRELCYVGWSATEIRTDYGRVLRDVDVACETDTYDTVATLVRIPDVVDPDQVSGYGSGSSFSGCRLPPWIRDREGNATGDDR